MNIDLTPIQPTEVPAKPAVQYPLNFNTKLLLEGGPTHMRAYAEMTPFRRIYADVPYEVTPAQPILDADGNPVLDAEGMPTYTPAVMGVHENVLVGAELMPSNAEGFKVTTIEVPNIMDFVTGTPESDALTGQALMAFLQAGGDLGSLTMACVTLMLDQIGTAQGKLKA
jgi:hypothetical protein